MSPQVHILRLSTRERARRLERTDRSPDASSWRRPNSMMCVGMACILRLQPPYGQEGVVSGEVHGRSDLLVDAGCPCRMVGHIRCTDGRRHHSSARVIDGTGPRGMGPLGPRVGHSLGLPNLNFNFNFNCD